MALQEVADAGDVVKSDLDELQFARVDVLTPLAHEELQDLARARSKKTGQTFEQAYREVIFDRPDLYEKCLKERHEKIIDLTAYLESDGYEIHLESEAAEAGRNVYLSFPYDVLAKMKERGEVRKRGEGEGAKYFLKEAAVGGAKTTSKPPRRKKKK